MRSSDDLARELAETPDTPSHVWQPAVGDIVAGTVRDDGEVPSKYGNGTQRRLMIETDTGEMVTVYARHTVLLRELDEQQPVIGDRIAIRRLQDVPGKLYKRYKVIVDHANASAVMSRRSPEPDTPLLPASPTPSFTALPSDEGDEIEFAFGPNTGEVQ